MAKGFRQMLADRQVKVNSLVCVGLDPLSDKVPECVRGGDIGRSILRHMIGVIDATAPYACMYKPQRACYEAIAGSFGEDVLREIIIYIHSNYPDIPVFLDCKRGDIGRTQKQYGIAHFDLDRADGINFNPYMGRDCIEALAAWGRQGKALVGLCYTSNPDAREIQDIRLDDESLLWEYIAEKTIGWAEDLGVLADAGLVMAAAHETKKGSGEITSRHLSVGREIVGDTMWFLIPGIGTQGGEITETVQTAFCGPGSIAINSSSGIIFASQGEDYAASAANEAMKLRDQIRAAGGDCQ